MPALRPARARRRPGMFARARAASLAGSCAAVKPSQAEAWGAGMGRRASVLRWDAPEGARGGDGGSTGLCCAGRRGVRGAAAASTPPGSECGVMRVVREEAGSVAGPGDVERTERGRAALPRHRWRGRGGSGWSHMVASSRLSRDLPPLKRASRAGGALFRQECRIEREALVVEQARPYRRQPRKPKPLRA